MSSTSATIYGLRDPRSMELRYVGKARRPRQRLAMHLCPTQLAPPTHRNRWIKTLLRDGLQPEMILLEEGVSDWKEAEQFWIAYMRGLGARLTNATAGGEGLVDPSPEVRERCGAGTRGKKMPLSPERHAATAARNRARASDPAWLAKMATVLAETRKLARPHQHNAETKARMGETQRSRIAKLPSEARLAMGLRLVSARGSKPETPVVCPGCNTVFLTNNPRRVACSGKCNMRIHRKRAANV